MDINTFLVSRVVLWFHFICLSGCFFAGVYNGVYGNNRGCGIFMIITFIFAISIVLANEFFRQYTEIKDAKKKEEEEKNNKIREEKEKSSKL